MVKSIRTGENFMNRNSGTKLYLPVPRSVMPMGNVTKYLQKLGMGIYDNENQPGVSKK